MNYGFIFLSRGFLSNRLSALPIQLLVGYICMSITDWSWSAMGINSWLANQNTGISNSIRSWIWDIIFYLIGICTFHRSWYAVSLFNLRLHKVDFVFSVKGWRGYCLIFEKKNKIWENCYFVKLLWDFCKEIVGCNRHRGSGSESEN